MKTQAWGWLAAAVMAAGLNASYHDGGFQWAHQMVNRVTYNAGTVLALATGNINQLQSAVQMASIQDESAPCPFAALARLETRLDPSDGVQENFAAIAARQEAQLARLESGRARIEARVARLRIPAVAFNPVVVPAPHFSICPRVRVSVPRVPAIKPPMVRVALSTPGPV